MSARPNLRWVSIYEAECHVAQCVHTAAPACEPANSLGREAAARPVTLNGGEVAGRLRLWARKIARAKPDKVCRQWGELTMCDWTTVLSGLLTPVVAAGVGYIAYRQWVTARNRLNFDLFEKRLVIYEAAMSFAASVLNNSKVREGDETKYLEATRSSRWLFDQEFAKFLKEGIFNNAADLHVITAELPSADTVEKRKDAVASQRQKKELLAQRVQDLEERAAKFLQLQSN